MTSASVPSQILVIGYGNPLRGDDALGWHAIEALQADAVPGGSLRLEARHQLLPEMTEWLAAAALAIFVDVSVDVPAGTLSVRELHAVPGPTGTMTHHWTPEALLAGAKAWFGQAPRAVLVSLGAASLDPGEGLSPSLQAALPTLIETIRRLMKEPVHA